MKYTNVFYVPHFNVIGGIETYIYELVRKYKDEDIPIEDIYTKVPKNFKFEAPKDIYDKLLIKGKKTYNGEKQVYVKALKSFYDSVEKEHKTKQSDPYKVSLSRAEELINHPRGELVEIIKE